MDQLNTIIGSEFYDLESNKWTIHGITERRQLLILWSRENRTMQIHHLRVLQSNIFNLKIGKVRE